MPIPATKTVSPHKGLFAACVGSVCVHAVLLASYLWFQHHSTTRKHPPLQVLNTTLVKLGKERPKDLLPRITSPEPPAAPPVNIPTTPTSKPASKPEEPVLPSAKERLQSLSKVSQALQRLQKQPTQEGSPDGSQNGTVSDASLAMLGNKYGAEIHRCIQKHYAVLGLNPTQVQGKTATVLIKIRIDGTLGPSHLLESSGLPAFDSAVQRAVRLCGKVSPPPSEIRDIVLQEGLEIVFQPS
jgi:TonB family protein